MPVAETTMKPVLARRTSDAASVEAPSFAPATVHVPTDAFCAAVPSNLSIAVVLLVPRLHGQRSKTRPQRLTSECFDLQVAAAVYFLFGPTDRLRIEHWPESAEPLDRLRRAILTLLRSPVVDDGIAESHPA